MKAAAQTVIVAYPFRGAEPWYAFGECRYEAEMRFAAMILRGEHATPAYRIVCQANVDQHDYPAHLCSGSKH